MIILNCNRINFKLFLRIYIIIQEKIKILNRFKTRTVKKTRVKLLYCFLSLKFNCYLTITYKFNSTTITINKIVLKKEKFEMIIEFCDKIFVTSDFRLSKNLLIIFIHDTHTYDDIKICRESTYNDGYLE